jgi:hypothetical protein
VIIQTGESIKREAVYGDVNGGREQRTLVEADPMNVMVIQHGLLNYPAPLHRPSLLYGWNGYRSITIQNINNGKNLEMRKPTWDLRRLLGKAWSAPESAPTKCEQFVHYITLLITLHPSRTIRCSPIRTSMDLAQRHPRKPDQTQEEEWAQTEGYISIYVRPIHCSCY